MSSGMATAMDNIDRPRVTLTYAQSLDGSIAARMGVPGLFYLGAGFALVAVVFLRNRLVIFNATAMAALARETSAWTTSASTTACSTPPSRSIGR